MHADHVQFADLIICDDNRKGRYIVASDRPESPGLLSAGNF